MHRYKISSLSFSLIFICLLSSSLLGIVFPYILHESNTSFYISLGISYLMGLILIFIFLKIFNFKPEMNIFEKLDYAFPKVISKTICVIIYILVMLITTLIFYRLVTFISSEFLIETPNLFILILLATPLLYLLFYDFDVIARLSIFCVFLAFLLAGFNIISLFSQIDLSNLKPLLNFDFIHTSKSMIAFTFIFIIPAFMTLAIPKDNVMNSDKIWKYILISYTLTFIFVFLVFFVIATVLGINIATLYVYPSYVVLKTITVLSFVQNIENISILPWALFMTFASSFCLLFLKCGISNTFKLSEKKLNILTILIGFLPIMIASYLLIPYEIRLNKYKYVIVPVLIYAGLFIIFLLTFIVGKIKAFVKKEIN